MDSLGTLVQQSHFEVLRNKIDLCFSPILTRRASVLIGCLSSYRSTIACSGTEIDRASGAWSSLSCLYWDHVAGRALKRKGLQLLRLNTKRTNPIYLLRAGLQRWSFIGLSSIETLGEPSKIHLGLFGRKRKRQCWPNILVALMKINRTPARVYLERSQFTLPARRHLVWLEGKLNWWTKS